MGITVKEIETAILELPEEQLRQFRAWYEKFNLESWDEQIERDAISGKLDAIADAAIADHKAGKSRKL